MRPMKSDLHIDVFLSNLSIGYMNAPSAYVASKVFPVVNVPKQSDLYPVYKKDFWFRDEAKKRGRLTESAGGGYDMDTSGSFYCHEYSFHKDIADQDRFNADAVFNIENDAVKYVVNKLQIRHEVNWASTYFGTGIWDNDLVGVSGTPGTDQFKAWDLSGSTPIQDIEDGKDLVLNATGIVPNTLVVSKATHNALKNHTDVIDRFKYTQTGIITENLLASVFELDNYCVARAIYATNNEGGTETLTPILNTYDALLVYAAPSPSLWTPSGGYTFRWTRPRIAGREGDALATTIKKYRLDTLDGDRVEGAVFEDIKLISSACGVYFDDAVAAGRTLTGS